MIENIIVGGGFSALSAKLALGSTASFSILSHTLIKKNNLNLRRVRDFEVNKIFQNFAYSYAYFGNSEKNLYFHDRMIMGGHSNIWGGFIDKSTLSPEILKSLADMGIILSPINNETCYSSSSKGVHQLRDVNNKILDVKNFLTPDYDGHLVSLSFNGSFYRLGYIDNISGDLKILFSKKVILCMGLIQTLNFIIKNYNRDLVFALSEHNHSIGFKFSKKVEKIGDGFVMYYSLFSAMRHFLGIKNRLYFLDSFSNLFPIFIRQKYSDELSHLQFRFVKDSRGNLLLKRISGPEVFGTSIHYFNLRINNFSLDDFFKEYFPGIVFLGAGSIKNCNPGPISNYILNDAFEKLSHNVN
ncbi:MAG: hypothetical protein FJZ43_04085 [Candidatus Staskawiczbacteria bacterium]|nr:hypothetical protein [Candidatus Staskawiczbacteria bacterium]